MLDGEHDTILGPSVIDSNNILVQDTVASLVYGLVVKIRELLIEG